MIKLPKHCTTDYDIILKMYMQRFYQPSPLQEYLELKFTLDEKQYILYNSMQGWKIYM